MENLLHFLTGSKRLLRKKSKNYEDENNSGLHLVQINKFQAETLHATVLYGNLKHFNVKENRAMSIKRNRDFEFCRKKYLE